MPSRRRSRSVFENNDAASPATEALKRQRRHGSHGDDGEEPGGKYEEEEQDNTEEDDGGSSQTDVHYAPNEYSPGAVVRVKLVNFVTYEKAEFRPGPNLNMIIGPNGTGKSSLVCALALGLGYPTSVLGRATKYSEYVTHGRDSASIEIELQKRPHDQHNHVVRLQIMRESNTRRFWLNKREVTVKKVQSLISKLRIACDNLCQFLPQEKVAEFAGLTPVQLLHETLRAAAPEEMINWQTELKSLFKDYKGIKTRRDADKEQLADRETRQQGLQADVDRLRERETIKSNIADIRKARICAEYSHARNRNRAAKGKAKDAKKRLKDLEQACGPAIQAVNAKEDYRGRIEEVLGHRKRALRDAEAVVDQAFRSVEQAEEKIKDTINLVNNEKKQGIDRKTEVGRARQMITKLEADYKSHPPRFDPTEWNQKIREQEHIMRSVTEERRESEEKCATVKEQGRLLNSELAALKEAGEALDSQEGQKVNFLKKLNPEVHQGWEWLQDNLDKFEKPVFGPPMLTCSLKDERYSSLVQSMLQANDFLCFTCQTRNDHKTLSEQFYKNMSLSVTIRTCGTEFQSFRSPMTADELHTLGLDGFAIDYMEGPDPVLAMLCSERFLHASGVALDEISSDQYDTLQNGQKINTWATGQTYFRVIRRREYGPDATTTSTRKVNQGRFWTEQPIDTEEKVEIQRKISEKLEQKKVLVDEFQAMKAQSQELVGKGEDASAEIKTLRQEKSELQAVHTKWTAIPDQIEIQKTILVRAQEVMQACRSRMAKHELARDELVVEKAQTCLLHKDSVAKIRNAHLAIQEVQIRLIEAASDVRGLKQRNGEITQELDEKKQEIINFEDDARLAKEEAVEARAKVQRIADDGEALTRYEEMVGDKSLEEIDQEIEEEKAKLELIHAVDPSVLRQFEQRAKEIEELAKRTSETEGKLQRLEDQIKELMDKFEPRLEDIIGRVNEAFGKNFERISCAGEVGLHKDVEDFEQWSIEIKVKFRQNEELQQLNQHRQSGGERAVSTVFYIMALQSMAQAPFRVVDEINQGMDPRNERMVHERMVEIACKEHTSQYFLITPKLLTGLAYDDNMRILCIASGVGVPEDGDKLDFDALIQRQLSRIGRVNA